MLNIEMNVKDEVLVVELEGELDNMTSPDLEEQLEKKREDVKGIVFDASKLTYISSAGLRVIMSTEKYMKSEGKDKTKMINANDDILEIIELCGFDQVVDVC